jgi:lysophospholipase
MRRADVPARRRRAAVVLALATLGGNVAAAGETPYAPPTAIPAGLEMRFEPPPGFVIGTFRNADGARLRYGAWQPTGRVKGIAILAPGFSEHIEKYFETMRDLGAMGLAVWTLDWRGQGGSERYLPDPERAHSRGFDNDVRDLDQFIHRVVRPAPGLPTVLVSHSMGGNISLRYLEEHPGSVSAAVFSAAALSFGPERGWRRALMRAAIWSAARGGLGERYVSGGKDWTEAEDAPTGLSHDPVRGAVQKRWYAANPTLRLGSPTYGWMDAFMASYEIGTRPEALARITTPTLFGVPLADPVVNPGAELAACAAIKGCRAVTFAGSWHELFMERDDIRARWIEAVAGFVAATTSRAAPP